MRWPDRDEVLAAARAWAETVLAGNPGVARIGVFGSYARGDWGFGSDIDLLILLKESPQPFLLRAKEFDATRLAVPADLLVYTLEEWARMAADRGVKGVMTREGLWLAQREGPG